MLGETDNGTGVTTGELSRAVGLIRGDIKDVKKDIQEKPTQQQLAAVQKEALDKIDTVRREAKAEAGGLRQRIVDLENWQTWALRLGIPGLVAAALNAINTFGGAVAK